MRTWRWLIADQTSLWEMLALTFIHNQRVRTKQIINRYEARAMLKAHSLLDTLYLHKVCKSDVMPGFGSQISSSVIHFWRICIKQSITFTKVRLPIVKKMMCTVPRGCTPDICSAVLLNYVSIKTTHPSKTCGLIPITLLDSSYSENGDRKTYWPKCNHFWQGAPMWRVTSKPGNTLWCKTAKRGWNCLLTLSQDVCQSQTRIHGITVLSQSQTLVSQCM